MSEGTPTNINNNPANPNPTPAPAPNPTPNPAPAGIDPAKFTDEDWNKIYENDTLYKHNRFSKLREDAEFGKQAREAQKKAEEEKLKEQQKFDELAKRKEEEATTWKSKYENAQIDNQIIAEASKNGVVDVDAVLKLLDRSAVKLTDNGVEGVKEAVEKLLSEKSYLLGSNNNGKGFGKGANPTNTPSGQKKFTLSQMRDHAFYTANRAEILEAQKKGEIDYTQ